MAYPMHSPSPEGNMRKRIAGVVGIAAVGLLGACYAYPNYGYGPGYYGYGPNLAVRTYWGPGYGRPYGYYGRNYARGYGYGYHGYRW
jgi:hypothetical protein